MSDQEDKLRAMLTSRTEALQPQLSGQRIRAIAAQRTSARKRLALIVAPMAVAATVIAIAAISLSVEGGQEPVQPGTVPSVTTVPDSSSVPLTPDSVLPPTVSPIPERAEPEPPSVPAPSPSGAGIVPNTDDPTPGTLSASSAGPPLVGATGQPTEPASAVPPGLTGTSTDR